MGYHFRQLDNDRRTVRTTQSHIAARMTPSKRGNELLDALEEMILREGFASLGVSEIASRLCCSKRTLYDLAPSKHALVLLVLSRFFARIRSDAVLACETSNDARQCIYVFLQIGVRAAEHLSPASVADIHGWPPARAIWQEHVRMRVEGLTRLIDSGTCNGEFRKIPPAFVAEVVFASINRLHQPDFYEFTNLTISEAFDELYSMLLAALTPDAANQSTAAARHTPGQSGGLEGARD
jgi:AcrR family transcriptional regulator